MARRILGRESQRPVSITLSDRFRRDAMVVAGRDTMQPSLQERFAQFNSKTRDRLRKCFEFAAGAMAAMNRRGQGGFVVIVAGAPAVRFRKMATGMYVLPWTC